METTLQIGPVIFCQGLLENGDRLRIPTGCKTPRSHATLWLAAIAGLDWERVMRLASETKEASTPVVVRRVDSADGGG